jgi:shikimate kinase
MLVYLLGMPGTGKSSIGKNVAKMLGYNFIDLDKQIEIKAKISVTEIWEKFGEDYFRKLESETLKEQATFTNCIVACGGGTPCFFDNMSWMNANGFTLFLELKLELLAKRIFESKESRPMFLGKDTTEQVENTLNEVYSNRIVFYQMAQTSLLLNGTFPHDFYCVKEKITKHLLSSTLNNN